MGFLGGINGGVAHCSKNRNIYTNSRLLGAIYRAGTTPAFHSTVHIELLVGKNGVQDDDRSCQAASEARRNEKKCNKDNKIKYN